MQAIHPGYTVRASMHHSARRPSRSVIRRRRLVTMFFVVALAFLAWSGLRQLADTSGGGPLTAAGRSVSDPNAPQLIAQSTVVVQSGDTLWAIARRMQPTGDVRPLVSALIDAHGGRPLQVGETIRIP